MARPRCSARCERLVPFFSLTTPRGRLSSAAPPAAPRQRPIA